MTTYGRPVRILFVGINYRYLNPTPSLLMGALADAGELFCFGPGFVSDSALAAGIGAFADSIGTIDVIVASKDVATVADIDRLNNFLRRYGVPPHPIVLRKDVMEDVRTFLIRHRDKVFVSTLDLDIIAVQQSTLDALLECGGYFMGWGPEAMDLTDPTGELHREPYFEAKKKAGLTIGLFNTFTATHARRILEVAHFVSDSEVAWDAISTRSVDVSVPGARYYRRRVVSEVLRRQGRFSIGRDRYRLVLQAADRLGFRPMATQRGIEWFQSGFQRMLMASRCCVTEGGVINFTIRKFVEIPAAGALLVCWPTADLKWMGYRDGVHCLFVERPQDVVDIVGAVAADPDRFQHVATAGRDLVVREHSVAARARQFRKAFHAILDGRFEAEYSAAARPRTDLTTA